MMTQAARRVTPDTQAFVLETARRDIRTFNRFVYRNQDGEPWETTPFHLEWHRLIAEHDRLVLFAPAGHGKSSQIARAWITRFIGQHPNSHAAILCNEHGAAKKRLLTIREDIEANARLRAVYPGLRPHPRLPWTDTALYCDRAVASIDPTLQAVGIHGALIGARLHAGIIDDPCDFENTWTLAQCERSLKWILSTFVSRFDGRGKIVCIMTTWNNNDVGHMLIRKHGWYGVRYQACDEHFGNILWPERFSEATLRKMHSGEGAIGPVEFARTMRNVIMSDEFRRISERDIDQALMRGRGVAAGLVPPGAALVVCGIDPAGGKKAKEKRGDLSALVIVAVLPNGDRQLVHVEAGRLTSPQLRERIRALWGQYKCMFAVEDNGVQDWLRQEVVNDSAIPIVGRSTTAEKWNPATGVESIGLELANGKWIIPATAEGRPATAEIQAWVDDMLTFQHGAHTGDRLMASYVCRSEIRELEAAQEARRQAVPRFGSGLEQRNEWGG